MVSSSPSMKLPVLGRARVPRGRHHLQRRNLCRARRKTCSVRLKCEEDGRAPLTVDEGRWARHRIRGLCAP